MANSAVAGDDSIFAVGVGVRIVPASIEQHDGAAYLRAALVFSPVGAKKAASLSGTPVDIRKWPTQIEALLKGVDVDKLSVDGSSSVYAQFSPVKDDTKVSEPSSVGLPAVSAFRAMLHDARRVGGKPIVLKDWQKQREADIGDIQRMWSSLIAPGGDDDWKVIVKALEKGGSTINSLISAQDKSKNNNLPDIRGIGRGQAALLLSLERGRSLLTRIRRSMDGDGCSGRDDECNLAAEIAVEPRSMLTAAQRANCKNPEKLLEAERKARENYERMSDIARKQRESELREDVLKERKAIERKAQEGVQERLRKLDGLTNERDKRAAAYAALIECAKDSEVAQCFMSVAAKSAEDLSRQVDASIDRQMAATADTDDVIREEWSRKAKDLEENYETQQRKKAPQTRLSGLQNQPSLARLFNLTVDVLIPLDRLKVTDAFAYAGRIDHADRVRFGYLTAWLAAADGTRRIWTTCKAQHAPDGKTIRDLWPCTQVELDIFTAFPAPAGLATRDGLIAQGTLPQIDGYLDLSASRPNNGVAEPRFDIITMDAPQALENRETLKSGARNGAAANGPPLLTQRTVGLAVVDRWRESSALVQALRTMNRAENVSGAKAETIDADDLTVGYRMDIGVFKDSKMTWRSLCTRWIRFGDDINKVEPLLKRVIPDENHRRAYDSAIVVMPAKLTKNSADDMVAFADDVVSCWTGPPMGVDTHSAAIRLTGTGAMQMGMLYSLSPDPDKPGELPRQFRIPRQMIGGGYFTRLAVRFAGGIIRDDPRTGASEAVTRRNEHAVLPSPKNGARRFLRHERIEAPVVATPEPILNRLFDRTADGLRETSNTIIVRSKARSGASNAFDPHDGTSTSYRVVIPASVSADFADRHGVFRQTTFTEFRDCDGSTWRGPLDGLKNVDYDQPNGGFPVYGFSSSSRGSVESPTDPQNKPPGDSIFRARRGTSRRRDPYYPDPAASYAVIAMRDLAGRLLPGDPLVVPIRMDKVSFPDVNPIAIEVVALGARSNEPRTQQRILGLRSNSESQKWLRGDACLRGGRVKPAHASLDGGAAIGRGPVAATHVQVALEPGESYEVDIWCLPTEDQLAQWFDAVESASLVASIDPETGQACISCEALAVRLGQLGVHKIAEMARMLGRSRAAAYEVVCTSGQVGLPTVAPRCIARGTHDLLKRQPVPEISARTTLAVTHAIPQAAAIPEVALTLKRTAPVVANPDPAAPQKAQTVTVGGIVKVDRATTGLFEIIAEGASLVSASFDDDQRRRRTSDEVARGIWPNSPVSGKPMTPRDVYGFDVAEDGTVTLPSEHATLLRVEDDLPDPSQRYAGLYPRDIDQLRDKTPGAAASRKPSGNEVRINAPFSISDSRARVLKLWAVAGSRTAGYFRDDKGDVVEALGTKPPEKSKQEIVVQATEPPAKLAPLTILPAFRLVPTYKFHGTTHMFKVERQVRLRIRMRRPWYTSGEGERLGIILWPPDIVNGRVSGDTAYRDYDVEDDDKEKDKDKRKDRRKIAMLNFEDDDLGPGGRYVTRWGLDPTKEGGKLGWLTPPAAFGDLPQRDCSTGEECLPNRPIYVPRVSIPVPVDENAATRRRVRLEAALLTYVPKFDIESETWFCDVDLKAGTAPEPFMRLGLVRYQPYAPPELRVSEPVVEWLQVPQHRAVTVMVVDNKPSHVRVEVEGTEFREPSVPGPEPSPEEQFFAWTKAPVMKVTVLRQRKDGVETVARLDPASCVVGISPLAERTWLPNSLKDWEDGMIVTPDTVGSSRSQSAVMPNAMRKGQCMTWSADFDLDEKVLQPTPSRATYRVLVEEVMPMLAGTFDDEPFSEKQEATDKADYACKVRAGGKPTEQEEEKEARRRRRKLLMTSGPRFAAVINLKPVAAG